MAVQPLDLHKPGNWKKVMGQLDELARLVFAARKGHFVLFQREGYGPELSRSSEALFLDLEVADPVKNVICQLVKLAVRDQINHCGDGGKILVQSLVAMVRVYGGWVIPLTGAERIQALQEFRGATEKVSCALKDSRGRVTTQPLYLKQYLSRELEDVPEELVNALVRYFDLAGEYTRLVLDSSGTRQDIKLEETKGYFVRASSCTELVGQDAFSNIERAKVLVIDGSLETPEDLQGAFGLAAGGNCVVFCRQMGELVAPTLIGNHKESQTWMVYEVAKQEHLQDLVALTGATLRLSALRVGEEDFGYADRVLWEPPRWAQKWIGQVCVQRWDFPRDLEKYALDLQQAVDSLGEGPEKWERGERLAFLTQDHFTLHLGNEISQVREAWRARLEKVVAAARYFRHGASMDYGNQILTSWELSERDRNKIAGLFQKEDKFPFPALVAAEAWDRARQLASTLLSTGHYLAPI